MQRILQATEQVGVPETGRCQRRSSSTTALPGVDTELTAVNIVVSSLFSKVCVGFVGVEATETVEGFPLPVTIPPMFCSYVSPPLSGATGRTSQDVITFFTSVGLSDQTQLFSCVRVREFNS